VYVVEGERNERQYLMVLSSDKLEGVIISDVAFEGYLLPILIKEGKITELSPRWGSIRKALVGDCTISTFKRWLLRKIEEVSESVNLAETYCLESSDITLYLEKGRMEYQEYRDIFFCDEEHMSPSLFRFGKDKEEKATREFPTARGSKWLANALLKAQMMAYSTGGPGDATPDDDDLSFEEIFSRG
jgi:hypothetical protein